MWVRGYVTRSDPRYPGDVFWVDQAPRRYGCFGFLFDIFMTILTSGFWLIWVFVREMRRR